MARTAARSVVRPPRNYGQTGLSVLLGLAIVVAMVALPPEAAIAITIVAAFAVFVLFDSWHAVILLLAARSSLDVLSEVAIVGSLNGAALLTAMMILVGVEHIARRRVAVLDLPLAKPFLTLLAMSAVTVPIAPDPALAMEHWVRWLSTVLLYFLIVDQLQDRRERGKFLGALMLSAIIPVLVGLYQLVAGEGNHNTEGFNRIYGTFVHPSPYGVYLLTLLPVALVIWAHKKPSLSKLGLGVLAIAMAVSTVFTFTRIVWLGGVVVLLVLGSAKTRAALVVIPVLMVLAFTLLPSVQQRFDGATETTGYESTGAWRIRHWDDQIAATTVTTLPLGSGLGAVEYVLGQPAHNDYLRIWVELGLFGSAAFLWLYFALIGNSIRSLKQARTSEDRYFILAFLALFAGRLVMSLTDNLLIQPVLEWYFWGLAAAAMALRPPRSTSWPATPLQPDTAVQAYRNAGIASPDTRPGSFATPSPPGPRPEALEGARAPGEVLP